MSRLRASMRRLGRLAAVSAALATLAFWPFAWRYTSFGFDLERADAEGVRCDWWRVRWPGDGTVGVLHEVTMRPRSDGPIESFDVGGALFVEPPPPGAADCLRFAVPHWALVIAAVLFAAAATFGCRRRIDVR